MRKAFLAFMLCMLSCSPNFGLVAKQPIERTDSSPTTGKVADELMRRGYTIAKLSESAVHTEWRMVRFFPDTLEETWIEVRIRVSGTDVRGDCIQKKWGQSRADLGYREPLWKRCSDKDAIAWIQGTVDSIAKMVQQ